MGRCDGRVIRLGDFVTRSDTSVTVICHVVSLTVLWLDNQSIDILKLFLAEPNHILQVTNGHKNL